MLELHKKTKLFSQKLKFCQRMLYKNALTYVASILPKARWAVDCRVSVITMALNAIDTHTMHCSLGCNYKREECIRP